MTDVIKYLEEIKEHQMQTVQLARSTEVYKLADKALKAIAVMQCCKSDSELLVCTYCGIQTNQGPCSHPKKCVSKEKIKAN